MEHQVSSSLQVMHTSFSPVGTPRSRSSISAVDMGMTSPKQSSRTGILQTLLYCFSSEMAFLVRIFFYFVTIPAHD